MRLDELRLTHNDVILQEEDALGAGAAHDLKGPLDGGVHRERAHLVRVHAAELAKVADDALLEERERSLSMWGVTLRRGKAVLSPFARTCSLRRRRCTRT